MDATTQAVQNQQVAVIRSRRSFMQCAAVLVAAPVAAITSVAEPVRDVAGEAEYLRAMMEKACLMMELQRSWFAAHEKQLVVFDKKMASDIYDLVTEGTMASRSLVRAAGIDLPVDYINSKVWRTSNQSGSAA